MQLATDYGAPFGAFQMLTPSTQAFGLGYRISAPAGLKSGESRSMLRLKRKMMNLTEQQMTDQIA